MNELISQLKEIVIKASNSRHFRHHAWYTEYHLNIVERIADELCEFYPAANRDLVRALVWIHDYGKTIAFANHHELTLTEGRKLLDRVGFATEFAERIIKSAETLDRHSEIDLSKASIEVQIVSSADGCSHLVGPFYYLWWWENPEKPFRDLMADNRQKLSLDWQQKIVLPEARIAFTSRYLVLLEQTGGIPISFFH
jgi:hypothetical protein